MKMTGLKISAGHSLDIPRVIFNYPNVEPNLAPCFIGDI